jgi:hypothetical protein
MGEAIVDAFNRFNQGSSDMDDLFDMGSGNFSITNFKNKYKYNIVKFSSSYLDYYMLNNDSGMAKFIKLQQEITGEISILYVSLYLISHIEELSEKKNKEILSLLFLPYLCYNANIEFYPN